MKDQKDDTPPQHRRSRITAEQAAEYTGLSVRTIYKYCRGDVRPVILHRRGPDGVIRIFVEDLEDWFEKLKDRPRKPRVKKPKPTPSENR
jgi:hypothetical protein